MMTGWQWINNSWYYLHPNGSNGSESVDWRLLSDSEWIDGSKPVDRRLCRRRRMLGKTDIWGTVWRTVKRFCILAAAPGMGNRNDRICGWNIYRSVQ